MRIESVCVLISLCDQTPLDFTFVTIDGIVVINGNEPSKVYKWAKIIVPKYMGYNKSKVFVRGNSAEGEMLIKIKPIRVIGKKDMARWLPINLTYINK